MITKGPKLPKKKERKKKNSNFSPLVKPENAEMPPRSDENFLELSRRHRREARRGQADFSNGHRARGQAARRGMYSRDRTGHQRRSLMHTAGGWAEKRRFVAVHKQDGQWKFF